VTAKFSCDPGKTSAFSSLAKIQVALKQTEGKSYTRETQAWLEHQEA